LPRNAARSIAGAARGLPVICRALAAVMIAMSVMNGAAAPAVEEPPNPSARQPQEDAPADSSAKDADPPPADPGDQTDVELLNSLDPGQGDAVAQSINRMERIIAGMREAHDRLARANTGPETRQVQQRVIEDLEKLLEQLKNQQNAQQNQNQNQNQNQKNQQQNSRNRRRGKQGARQPDPRNSARGGTQNQPAGQQQRGNDPASDSEERVDPARALAEEAARRELMIKDIWGHLPPQIREALRNAYNEKYLPKYEDLVKKYYESLAERNRKRRP